MKTTFFNQVDAVATTGVLVRNRYFALKALATNRTKINDIYPSLIYYIELRSHVIYGSAVLF